MPMLRPRLLPRLGQIRQGTKRFWSLIALVVGFIAATATALAQGHLLHRDIPYAGAGSAPLQTLDTISAPANASCPPAGCPVLVFVHGGGWQRGDKQPSLRFGRTYARAGITFVTLNYRLSPAVQHPAHVEDVATAIAWVKANIAEYGGDPRRVFLMGHSAGAHLVSLVVTDRQFLATHGIRPDQIAGVIPLDTATYDLTFFGRTDPGDRREPDDQGRSPFKQTAFTDSPETWRAASPLHTIHPGTTYPPFLIIYAAHRLKTAAPESERFAEALRTAGTRVETLAVPNRTHQTIFREQVNRDDPVTRAVIGFVTGAGGP